MSIRRDWLVTLGAATALAFAAAPTQAAAETPSPASTAAAAPTSTPTPPTTGTPTTPTPAAPVAGRLRLSVLGARGPEPFALTGEKIVVRGVVTPFVAGQQVAVHFYRGGRMVQASTVAVRLLPHHKSVGQFSVSYASAKAGPLRVVAVHSPTSQMALFAAGTALPKVISPNLSSGARGETVHLLQRKLGALHYAVPQSGNFDEATADAVIAYRKMTDLPLVPYTDAAMFRRLKRGDGAFHVRFPRDGRHIEADLTHQVLVEIEPHGRVANIYMMSSGKPSTPTVLGHFVVYRKEPGVNSELMYDSNYFISGYAIHGYPEVPTYAASHGCLRVPYLDAPALFAWIKIGTIVDVYN